MREEGGTRRRLATVDARAGFSPTGNAATRFSFTHAGERILNLCCKVAPSPINSGFKLS